MTDVTARSTHLEPFDLATVDRLLTCTRAARRTLDLTQPVAREVIEECLELAVHAPTASNQQTWRWVVVTEPARKAGIARYYRAAWEHYLSTTSNRGTRRWGGASPAAGRDRNLESARFLAEHLHEIPVLIVPCVQGRPPEAAAIDERWRARMAALDDAGWSHHRGEDAPRATSVGLVRQTAFFGSIFPAVWSLQLALRSRGLGSAIASMHVPFEPEVGELLGLPRSVTQVCLVPVAHLTRDLGPAPRRSAEDVTHWETW